MNPYYQSAGGVEADERHSETIALRMSQDVLDFGEGA